MSRSPIPPDMTHPAALPPVNSEMARRTEELDWSSTGLSPADLIDVVEGMTDGFIAINGDWRITYVNAAAERTNSMRREDLLGRNFWEAFPAVLRTPFERNLHRAMAERVTIRDESFYEPYGRWFAIEIHPIKDHDLSFYGRDITEQKRVEIAEHRLQRERDEILARLELQFERMPVACAVFDPQGRVIEWNPAAETTFGYARDEVIGRSGPLLIVPAALRPQLQEVIDRVASGDMSAHSVNENLTKNGRTIICEWRNTPLRNAAGEVIGILSMAQDITEQKRAEEAVRESEERYHSLISQVKDFAIFSTDERGIVTTWNEGCQVVLGYSQEEFIGLDTAQLFTAEDRAQGILAAELRQARETGTAGTERWMIARGGRRFFAVGATAAFRDSARRVIGFSWVVRDLTPMKEFQDQLTQRGESLERLVSERTGELEQTTQRLRISERMAALGTLAAGLGHDMGNLLLPMDVRLGLLIEADLPRELHEHVVGIQKCARYLQRLSSGLRLLATDPAHVESRGVTEVGRWWTDVHLILKDVLPAGIRFEHHVPESESWVGMGRTGLTQAVYNLVQNAADVIKEHGGSRVSLNVESEPSEPWITIRVADDGPGMTEEVARRCMEPYFSTKSRGESTGMGLSLVHALVTGAGGQVEIQSTPGQGTTISLVLPRALPREQTQDPSPDMAEAV